MLTFYDYLRVVTLNGSLFYNDTTVLTAPLWPPFTSGRPDTGEKSHERMQCHDWLNELSIG